MRTPRGPSGCDPLYPLDTSPGSAEDTNAYPYLPKASISRHATQDGLEVVTMRMTWIPSSGMSGVNSRICPSVVFPLNEWTISKLPVGPRTQIWCAVAPAGYWETVRRMAVIVDGFPKSISIH